MPTTKKAEDGELMRILYVHHRSELGGAPTSLLLLLREISKKPEVTFRVLCPKGPALSMFLREAFDAHSISISGFYHIPGNKYQGLRWLLFVKEVFFLIPHLWSLWRHLTKFQPHIVHLNEVVLIPAAWLSRLSGSKVVWHIRGVIDHGHYGFRRQFVMYCLRNWASAVITIDDDERSDLDNVPQALTVHNSVDFHKFRQGIPKTVARDKLGLPHNELIVTMISRIQRVKGSYDFVHAANFVVKAENSAFFLLVGGPPRPASFFRTLKGKFLLLLHLIEDSETITKGLISRYTLLEKVKILDFIDNVEDAYTATDVIVFPSFLRGPSRSALESAAIGIPIVCSTEKWSDDVIKDGKTGFLVPQGDVQAIADAIIKLLKDPELRARMGRNARSHALKYFDPSKNANKIYHIYCTVMNRLDSGKM